VTYTRIRRVIRECRRVTGVTHTFGDFALLTGDHAAAVEHYRRALRQSLEIGYDRVVVAAALAGLAAADAARLEGADAGRCWALYERFAEREGVHVDEGTRVDYEVRIAELAGVERAVFDAAGAAVRDLDLDEAIAEVGSGP
jgi:hypothetical protein